MSVSNDWLNVAPPIDYSIANISSSLQRKKMVELMTGSIEVYDSTEFLSRIHINFAKTRLPDTDVDALKHRLQSAFSPLFPDTARFKISLITNRVLF